MLPSQRCVFVPAASRATFTLLLSFLAARERPGMITKVCLNNKCPSYGHFVYTVAMRCLFCRWDLRPAQRSGELVLRGTDAPRSASLSSQPATLPLRARR